uniref:Reverse transcriptase domain-containing protein n=1 Tax=Fundulus heteroclitus TaxID=8078 RepID=A0A3Q2QDV6_FUNHE
MDRLPNCYMTRLFSPNPRYAGIIFLTVDPMWRKGSVTRKKRLPNEVSVGIRAPWLEQPCPLCKLNLKTAGSAASHMIKVHRARKVEYFCKRCASGKTSLRSVSIHGGICGKRFKSKQIAGDHACNFCSRTFLSARGRSLHIRRMHFGTMTPMQDDGGSPTSVDSPAPNSAQLPTSESRAPNYKSKLGLKQAFHLVLNDSPESLKGLHPLYCTFKDLTIHMKRTIKAIRKLAGKKLESSSKPKTVRQRTEQRSKRNKYRILQNMYKKDRSTAAAFVLDGAEKVPCVVPRDVVENTYTRIWGGNDPFVGLNDHTDLPQTDNDLLIWPLTADEILSSIKGMKRRSAPGPDGIQLADLLSWDPTGQKLEALYNSMLYIGRLPNCLKESRTTLIPKSMGDELQKIENWRPITIGSSILRVLSNTLAKRLSEACPLNRSQRGFIGGGKGCAENLMVLDGIMNNAKKSTRSLAVVFIDLARAFDSVSHKLIEEVLKGRGTEISVVDFILDSYQGVKTRILTADGPTNFIEVERGVKQGDPLSPILFNMAIDQLHSLEKHGKGYRLAGHSITALAYADDLVLLSESWRGMNGNIRLLKEFLVSTGLQVKVAKCGGFYYKQRGTSRTLNSVKPWKLEEDTIPVLGPNDTIKYLGVQVSPTVGIVPPEPEIMIAKMIDSISKVPLKPTQKLMILHTFAVPRVTYVADVGMAKSGSLRKADAILRTAVKKWLHLEPSTVDGLLYAHQKDGGLGLVKLENQIPLLQLRRLIELLRSGDKTCAEVTKITVEQSLLNRLYRRVLGESERKSMTVCDLEKLDADLLKAELWRSREFIKWTNSKKQGRGVLPYKGDRISNHWLKLPTTLYESELILALKLRSNTITETLAPIKDDGDRPVCRLCKTEKEALGHIISCCSVLKPNRMSNHNKICRLLAEVAASKGWNVERERRLLSASAGTGIPDLIFNKKRISIVADVAICYDGSSTFKTEVVKFFGFPLGRRRLGRRFARRAMLLTIDTVKVYKRLIRKTV